MDRQESQLDVANIDNPTLLRDIPFDKIYESARKEASRKKPAFFVHKYFARRITCNFRMMLLGVLLPYEEDVSINTNRIYIKKARTNKCGDCSSRY